MLESIVEPLSQYLNNHPTHGGIITCLIAFAESLAIVGSIIPGSVTMTMIGVLVGLSVLPFKATFAWAILGAILGDFASYFFGIYYQGHFRQFPMLNRYQHWIERGEVFIEKHGAKSIIIGRFFGPMRSMIPMVAGLLRMRPLYFTCAAIPSAILWAVLYLTPGVLIGAFSLELPHKLTTHFLLTVLGLIVGGGIVFGLLKYCLPRIQQAIQKMAQHGWQRLGKYQHWLAVDEATGSIQLIRLSKCLLSLLALLTLCAEVIHHGALHSLNAPLYHLFQSVHHHVLTTLMLAISFTDNKYVLLATAFAASAWNYYQGDKRSAWHWLALAGLTAVSVEVIKHLFDIQRPAIVSHQIASGSFPSGHVALCAATANFFGAQLSPMLNHKHRARVWQTVVICVLAIMLSRVYLGAHWLTDVLGGLALGLFISYAVQLHYYRQQQATRPRPRQAQMLLSAVMLAFSFAWVSYGLFKFPEKLVVFTYRPPQTSLNQWWGEVDSLPTLRNNRLGHPNHALNIQYRGSLQRLQTNLTDHQWQAHLSQQDFWQRIHHLLEEPSLQILPLFPQLHHQAPPVLVLSLANSNPTLILKLWDSHTTDPQGHQLYVGTLFTHAPPQTRLTEAKSAKQHKYFNHLPTLTQALPKSHWRIGTTHLTPSFDYWDGKVLQVDLH